MYIITGASSGIGEAIAAALLAPDVLLLLVSRTRNASLTRRAEAAGAGLEWFERDLADVAERDGADELMRELFAAVDSTDAPRMRLINNAGVLAPIGSAEENASGDVRRHLAVNLTAPMTLTAAFLRRTATANADKRVLLVSSGAGRKPYAGWSAYGAAKAGLDHFARCVKLEQEAMPYGARIASVAPGVVDTPMQAHIRETDERRFPSRERFVRLYESGGLWTPAEAAARLLRYLEHPQFGIDPVVDVRDWRE